MTGIRAQSKRLLFVQGAALFLSATLALFPLTGCSKKEDSASVSIKLPNLTKTSSAQSQNAGALGVVVRQPVLARVMINLTSNGKVIESRIWDVRDGVVKGQPLPSPPAAFVFEGVPRGVNVLFQVLALKQELDVTGQTDESGAMTFYYGDQEKALSGTNDNVQIALTQQGVTVSKDGQLAGRYVNADGSGPSGRIKMYFTPPGGRPDMVVDDRNYILNGVFEVFLPATGGFSYRTDSGVSLFENVTVNSFDAQTGNHLMKLVTPMGYRSYQGDTLRGDKLERTRVVGFFGPGAAGRKVCYDSGVFNITDLYTSATIGDQGRVSWNPPSANVTDARVLMGGVTNAGAGCPVGSGDLSDGHLALRVQSLAHGDSPVGTRGAFERVSGDNTFVSGSISASTVTLGWKYLRPALTGAVAGVGVFTKTLAAGQSASDFSVDSLMCSKLSGDGFTEVTRVAAGSPQSPVETYSINGVSTTDYNAGRFLAVLCPYSPAGVYHDSAVKFGSSGGGGNGVGAATQIIARRLGNTTVSSVGSPIAASQGVCAPLHLMLADAAGNPGYRNGATGPIQLHVSITAGTDDFLYADQTCTSGSAKTLTAQVQGSRALVFFKPELTVGNFTITATDTTVGGTALSSTTFYATRVTVSPATDLLPVVKTSARAFQCWPMTLLRASVSGADYIPQGGVTTTSSISAMIAANPGLSFFTDQDCTNPASSPYFNMSSQSSYTIFARYNGGLTSVSLTPDGSGLGLSPVTQTVTIAQPGPAATVRMIAPATIKSENCQPVWFEAQDSNGAPAPVRNGATTITPSYSQGPPAFSGFYSDPGCAAAIPTITIAQDAAQSTKVYFRWTTMGSVTVNGAAIGIVLPVAPMTMTVDSPPAAAIIARVPGVSWVFGSGYAGFGAQKIEAPSSLFDITLTAISPLGNPITTFNDSDLSPNGLYVRNAYDVQPTCGGISAWTSGSAVLSNCSFPNDGYSSGVGVQFRTGGGGSSRYPFEQSAKQFFITDPGETTTTFMFSRATSYYSGQCQPFMIQRRSMGTLGTAVASPVSIPLSGTNISYYSDASCSSNLAMATISPGYSYTVVFGKFVSSPPSPTADGASSSDPALGSPTTFTFNAPLTASTYKLVTGPTTVVGACEPVMVIHADVNGGAVVAGSSKTLSLSQSNMNADFYSLPDCSSAPTATVTMPVGESAKVFYYRPRIDVMAAGGITVNDGTFTGTLSTLTVYP